MKHTLKAFVYSCQGLCYAFRNEVAFRYDLVVFVLGMILVFLLPVSGLEAALMIFSLFFILLMELTNTAIETAINRISVKRHPLSGHAKDVGSALVLLAFINAILIWLLILIK